MPNALDKEDTLYRNLVDSGCDKKLTEECMRCFRDVHLRLRPARQQRG